MKYIIILLLLTTSLKAQTLYTLYDCATFRVSYSYYSNTPPESPLCYTTDLLTQNWAKPSYNPACPCYYNAATAEEQLFYLAQQEAANVSSDDISGFNSSLTVWQTDAMLNLLYPNQSEGFRLICPNVSPNKYEGTQTLYIKGRNGKWSYLITYKNKE